ncbi:RPEL repeat protein [Taphrina deformans PYCC 5710]|uniref:RPEL repeat protein n=1 Tax=Taphrina deformans (strain PYCC 5710 / ATCC 11124 / CBS 356.35 / IMI 108563 / JCM 9778 / NBRC 8474) TaxID=1097556 RepID=R4X719_TAPDE|nr:RPEL repeat protein [Taphrina deformans PYCC 5710]|eukprot:CCG81047.1 RPEL repeat protein [Taphrina deformans PYCC 5710]
MSTIENAIESAKGYATAGIEKATELGQQAIHAIQEQIGDSAPFGGVTRKESHGPLSPAEEKKLEDALASRPTQKELQEKNILKNTKVAPSLQAKEEELKQQQLKDSLDTKLAMRPTPDELTQKNILKEEPTSNMEGGIQSGVQALEKSQLEATLEANLEHRPAPEELIKEGILNKDENPKIA